jgi:hypothetical protein
MATRAEVVPNGREAILRQDGKTLEARLSGPPGAQFSALAAEPPADGFNDPNPGVTLLVVEAAAPDSGRLEIQVALQPESP